MLTLLFVYHPTTHNFKVMAYLFIIILCHVTKKGDNLKVVMTPHHNEITPISVFKFIYVCRASVYQCHYSGYSMSLTF